MTVIEFNRIFIKLCFLLLAIPLFFDLQNLSFFLPYKDEKEFFTEYSGSFLPVSIFALAMILLDFKKIISRSISKNSLIIVSLMIGYTLLNQNSDLKTFVISLSIAFTPTIIYFYRHIGKNSRDYIEFFFFGALVFSVVHLILIYLSVEGQLVNPLKPEDVGYFLNIQIYQSMVAYPSSNNLVLVFLIVKIFCSTMPNSNGNSVNKSFLYDVFFSIVFIYIVLFTKKASIAEALIFFCLKFFLDIYFKRFIQIAITFIICLYLIEYFALNEVFIDFFRSSINIESSNRAVAIKLGLSRIDWITFLFGSFSDRSYSGAHNIFIDIIFRGGFLSFLIMFFLYLFSFLSFISALKKSECPGIKKIILLAIGIFLVVSSMVNSNLTQPIFIVKLLFILFFIVGSRKKHITSYKP